MLNNLGKSKDYLSDKIDKINAEMSFCLQLKLLLWKNWLVRKRHKCRTILEFIWPVLMILIVVGLHSMGKKLVYSNCHFKAKAMPTAGEVLFLQTFFCAINNTCDEKRDATESCFVSSVVSSIADALHEAFNIKESKPRIQAQSTKKLNKGEERQGKETFLINMQNWIKDILIVENIIEAIQKNKDEKLDSYRNQFLKSESVNYTCTSVKFQTFDQQTKPDPSDQLSVNFEDNEIADENEKDILLLSRVKKKIYLASIIDSLFRFVIKGKKNKFVNDDSLLQQLSIVDYLFCGPHVPPILKQMIWLIKSCEKTGQNFDIDGPRQSQYVVKQSEWENDTSEFCNRWMMGLESTYPGRVLFRLFKPLLRGKLIYTPDVPVINKLMSRINKTFSIMSALIDVIKNEKESTKQIEKLKFEDIVNKFKNKESFLREIVQSEIGKMILKNFKDDEQDKNETENDEKHKVQKLLRKLDETVGTWKTVLADGHNKSFFSFLIPYLDCIDMNRIIPARDEESAVKKALHWLDRERLWGVIVFNDIPSDSKVLPPSVTYKIRIGIERTHDTNRIKDRIYVPRVKRHVIHDLREITGGLAYLQNMVEAELIREYTGRNRVPGIYLKQTPYPCHIYDSFRQVITKTFPMFMVVSWMFGFCMIIKRIVIEKEILFRGTLHVFGVTNTVYWLSWFLDALIPMVAITTVLSILLIGGGLLPNSNIIVIWIFLTAFTLPTITLAFLLSTFFFSSSFAVALSGMTYFLLYIPYPSIQNFGEALNPHFKIFTCLISNVGFGLGCTWIANMEEIGIGAQLGQISFSPVPGNPITMAIIIEMFLLDSVIYLLLAIYLDNVLHASDFARQPWYYFLTFSYWKKCWSKDETVIESVFPSEVHSERDERYFESEPKDLHVGIQVFNLSKEFRKGNEKKKVVKNLTVNFYEDQITSFLGHNGAGKTTTVAMMIGLLPITEGNVRIYGVDIKNNPRGAIKDIGVCRQENVLLDELTVVEHFKFFGKLKNRTDKEIETEIEELLNDLQLGNRAKKPVKILSGGMKRKVCVAMAFIGGSRTVFLDEPTAGIDPFARRAIWELLVKYKKGRTIVLTTHFLDEADILGDRIAIISSGELRCCGSNVFLKSNFGKGYYLTIESNVRSIKTGKKAQEFASTSNQIKELDDLIKAIIPAAKFHEQVGSEIVFILPFSVSPRKYNELFSKLDKEKDNLNLNSYGVTNSSLEEVFIKISVDAGETENVREEISNQGARDTDGNEEDIEIFPRGKNVFGSSSGISKKRILREHFFALMIKRFIHHRRNFKIFLLEVLLPTLFMAISLALLRTLPTVSEMPPLPMDISIYGDASFFYTNEYPDNVQISSYEKVLLGPYDFGTKCVIDSEKCSMKSISSGSLIADYNTEDKKICTCTNGYFECEADDSLKEPPNAKTSGGFTLYNLTGLDVSNWLLSTELGENNLRLGGISLGYFNTLTGMSAYEFSNLFMFKNFVKLLEKSIVGNRIKMDPAAFTMLAMTMSCNETYGKELFRGLNAEDNVIIWYNNRAWFASLALMNGVTNMVLRASLPNGTDASKYSIKFINHPLPITNRQLEDQMEIQTSTAFVCALSVIWALAFIPAMYGVYLVEESRSGLKNLEIVSGLNKTIYWLTNLVWDLASYTVSIFAIVILYYLYSMTSFIGGENVVTFVVLLYCYGFVNTTFVYMISFGFSVPSTAFIFIALWNIFSGVITLLVIFTLSTVMNSEDPLHVGTIFMIFPQFCFGKSLINMALRDIREQSLENYGVSTSRKLFEWNSCLKYMVIMLVSGVIYFLITLLLEYRMFQRIGFWLAEKRKKNIDDSDKMWKEREEDDVKQERERVEFGSAEDDGDVLIINNLTKIYKKGEPPAVDHISVGVKSGECFGLIGLNGAGKTTVFKMLTGYTFPTGGDATIGGFSIKQDSLKKKFSIGYCPQVHALDPYLTAEEHLSFFCRIRGVTGAGRKAEVSLKLERLGLTQQKNKIIKKLSGGNKRKVNTAIALSCDPELILLDEPTSGMDILSKRFLWNCLQDVILEGRCVVLTTHSMEECQALCTHLSIMIRGRFSCFGSCQHLKNKYNEGYIITILLLDAAELEKVTKYVEVNLPDSTLMHVHYKQITYKLSPKIFVGKVFTVMSEAKEEKLIQHYSITQTSLEDIFLKLVVTKNDEDEESPQIKNQDDQEASSNSKTKDLN